MAEPGSSRPTRSPPATSTPGSGASRRSRSSSPSARSSRGPSRSRRDRDAGVREPALRPRRARAPARRRSADEVVRQLTDADDGRDQRQLGVVDARGGSASYTGSACMGWAGGVTGPGFAAQGNILVRRGDGRRTRRPSRAPPGKPLAERLLDVPRRRAGRRRRPPWAAVGGHSRRRAERRLRRPQRRARRSEGRRPQASGRGADPALRAPRPAVRKDASARDWIVVDDDYAPS